MNTIYTDSPASDEARRGLLYQGQLFAYSNRASVRALSDFAGEMIRDAFGSVDPLIAQYSMPVEQFVEIFGPLKPKFIHNPETKRLIRGVLQEFGCDLEQTYQDVPRLRAVTSDGYLTSGVGYAHHLHRDTWYSAPFQQINWWLPIFEMASESSMAFHPHYWSEPVKNGSSTFNYYEWNKTGRASAAQHIKSDTRKQPKPEQEMELDPQIRIVPSPGGVVLFSAAQMHSTVANTSGKTRFSIDFRTVDLGDVKNMVGARNIDSECTGTSLRDFLRGADLSAMPEDVVRLYDTETLGEGVLVYQP
ncbi:MAG TPA: phytanoyl-CoA dioxygenase family protein [Edaphobacter sp.]|nr:phytanoyl-CoA dioxygenase family protein [Edaphobacter sp.]